MSVPEFSERAFYVHCHDCSASDLIFPSILTGNFQEVAEDAVVAYGVDTGALNDAGYCWIILRMTVEMDKYPRWREDFKVRTWSCGCNRLFWRRDYEVTDKDGNVIGRGTSEWIVADMNDHKPIRPNQVVEAFKDAEDVDKLLLPQNSRKAMEEDSPRLRFPEELKGEPVLTKYADYSELDHNHHVNNTRYVAWAYDAFYKLGIDVYSINKFDINYHAEVLSGEKVDLYHETKDGAELIYGYKGDGKEVFIFRGRK